MYFLIAKEKVGRGHGKEISEEIKMQPRKT